jgi:acyl carrier protein
MSVRLTITKQIAKIADEHHVKLAPLSDDMVLLESGLDSLCLAILVVQLEDALGVDPFTESENIVPVTFGDFVHAYENSAR